MQMERAIFRFSDPIDYLRFYIGERRRREPAFSVSSWARSLGYTNSSFLSQVLKRERSLKMNLVTRLAADLGLKGKALSYFECISLNNAAKTDAERKMYLSLAERARPRGLRRLENISPAEFSRIADWYYAAITESIHLKDFCETPEFLNARLGLRLSRKQISDAIATLLEAGRLSRDAEGRLRRGTGNAGDAVFMRSEVPSEAIRAHHLQMMELARAAVQKQKVTERYLRSTTIPIRRENYEKATEIVLNAHLQLLELAEPGGADEIYQMNTQLFRLTKSHKRSRPLQ